MRPHPPARDPVTTIADALAGGGEIRLINPSLSLLSAVVDRTHPTEGGGRLTVVLTPSVQAAIADRFPTAAQLADLAAADRAVTHTTSAAMEGTLVGGAVIGTVYARDQTTALLPLDTERWGGWVDRAWQSAVAATPPTEQHHLGYHQLHASLAERVAPPVAERFDALVATARQLWPVEAAIDPTALALLATACHGGQLAEVTAWGVDSDIASRATFSRVKSQLEDAGVLETTPIPQSVGRPRLRLELRQPHREDADPDALLEAAGSVIG
jgi:hypothetical protein